MCRIYHYYRRTSSENALIPEFITTVITPQLRGPHIAVSYLNARHLPFAQFLVYMGIKLIPVTKHCRHSISCHACLLISFNNALTLGCHLHPLWYLCPWPCPLWYSVLPVTGTLKVWRSFREVKVTKGSSVSKWGVPFPSTHRVISLRISDLNTIFFSHSPGSRNQTC